MEYQRHNHLDVWRHIRKSVGQAPDKAAVWVGEKCLSYRDLFLLTDQFASGIHDFISRGNRKKNIPVRIGVFVRRNERLEAAILSIIKLGCTYVPIDTETPVERIAFIAEDASLAFFLTEEAVKDQLPQGVPTLTVEEILQKETREVTADYATDDNEAYFIFTSGTTGRPKGVRIDYTNLYYFLLTCTREDNFHFHHDSVVLHYTSINFDVSVLELYNALFNGATLVVVNEEERKDVKKVYQIVNKRKVTFMFLPPTMFNLFTEFNFAAMETACTGGEAMPRSLAERIGKRPYRFINGYGPAECTPISSMRDVTSPDLCRNIGWASPYGTFVVVDEQMRPVRPGEEGELLIGGPQVFGGYLNRPELTKEKLIDNPFADSRDRAPKLYHTGDIVRLCEDGSCEFVGRMDSQVKVYSHRIELGEILVQLEQCEEVRGAYVRMEDTGSANKRIVAFIQPRDPKVCQSNAAIIDAIDKIKKQIRVELPDYMIPTMWNFIPEFPITINGKIDDKKLVNRPFYYIDIDGEESLTSDERILKQELCRVMEFDNISIHEDLFDVYGLSSIQTMQVSMDLNRMGMQVSVLEMYKHRTIHEIIQHRDARLNYWYNDGDDTEKPVIIVISGYTSFGNMYTQLADRLTDKYAIYVVDYYHAILDNRRVKDLEELMAIYREMVAPVVARHKVSCFMGICFGGEHALLLAHQLYADKAEKPHVVVIDGEVDRDTRRETNGHLHFDFLSEEENAVRIDNDFTVMETYPDFYYEGKLSVFLSRDYVAYEAWFDPDWTEVKANGLRHAFDTNRERWENHYPDCHIEILPSDHANFWNSEPSLTILADYFMNL